MSTIVLGCDRNGANDSKCQNAVAKILEKAGHKVEKLSIGPNDFAKYSYSNKAKGKIGVYLIAAGITSIADLYDGNTNFKYAYFGIRGDLGLPRMKTKSDFEKNPISKDKHGDCISKSCNKLAGKTYPQMNEIVKSKCQVVFGSTCDELGNAVVKAMGGQTSSSKSNESTGSTIKEALKKAVSSWDGDVSIHCIGDTVYVGKIPDPTMTILKINEFEDVIYDSITVTDVNPNTINHLTCTYKDYQLVLKDDILIKRFGKISKKIACPSSVKSLKQAESFIQREFNKIRRDDGRQVECKIKGNTKWRSGAWVKAYFPSYFIDDYMYISKCSHEEDGTSNWIASLTLVDYPPSFGTFEETEESK